MKTPEEARPRGWPAATGVLQQLRPNRRPPRTADQGDAAQLALFASPRVARPVDVAIPPPANATETSREAARRIGKPATSQRAAILRYLVERGPAGGTDEEIQDALGLRVQTETPRRGELAQLGLVVDSGRTRPTSSGRPAIVWVATGVTGMEAAR